MINAAGFLYLWATKNQINSPAPLKAARLLLMHCSTCNASSDVLSYALQLGRLDFVSFSLTLLGIVIALTGFAAFWVIRREAIIEGQDAAKKAAGEKVLTFFQEEGKDVTIKAAAEEVVRFLSNEGSSLIDKSVLNYYQELLQRYTPSSLADSDTSDSYDDIAQGVWDNDKEGDADA